MYILSPVCATTDIYSEICVTLKSRNVMVSALLSRNSISVDFEQTQTGAVFVATAEQTVARWFQVNTCNGK